MKQRITLIMEGSDLPGWPLAVRLRICLKRLLRYLKLRCLLVTWEDAPDLPKSDQ